MAMPTMLRWSLKRLPLRKKECLRLEREELDAKGFVTNLERLLLATDDSANGKFAAQLAGIVAGSAGKPTTILDLAAKAKKDSEKVKRRPRRLAKRGTTQSRMENVPNRRSSARPKRRARSTLILARRRRKMSK
jgi:hypothetical protein